MDNQFFFTILKISSTPLWRKNMVGAGDRYFFSPLFLNISDSVKLHLQFYVIVRLLHPLFISVKD